MLAPLSLIDFRRQPPETTPTHSNSPESDVFSTVRRLRITMSSVHNSVDTVNAAATAIVTADSRAQPSTIVQKRRWGSCWSIYRCFGSYKHNKRIGHAVLVSEPASTGDVGPSSESRTHPSTIVMPFIAPPSSPASFLQSEPPSATHSPAAGLLSLAALSVHSHSPGGTAPMFTIGPYAHETQLVSPPVFSTFTTEPSTACFTPPPEAVQMTTPSSPEVPFAQLLSSSLARNRRNTGTNLKYNLSQYEFQPYQYPGSPGGHSKSPGSAFSTSGTSSPFPDKLPSMGEAPKFIGYEHFPNYKWDSRVGSGSLTPNGWGSRLGSGALTPNGGEPPSRDGNQIYEVASLANPEHKPQNDDNVVDHRVSFELFGEDIPTCIVREPTPSHRNVSTNLHEAIVDRTNKEDSATKHEGSFREQLDTSNDGEGEEIHQKHRTISLGSSKEFNFNNPKGEVSEKSSVDCEWWTSEDVVREELSPRNSWSFFPMLQSGAS